MRVLLEDGFSVEKGTGIGRYTQNLANELGKQEGVVLSGSVTQESLARIRPVSVRRILYTAWLETGFQNRLVRLRPDIVHFTNHLVPRSRKSPARYVVTVHDLTAWRLPGALPPLYARYIRTAISRAVRAADLILCPSGSIRNEVIGHFGMEKERVRTAWNMNPPLPELSAPKREELFRQLHKRWGIRKPFLLFVGTMERRKNVVTLVDALARIAGTTDLQLVMVGRPGYGFSEIRAATERQTAPDRFVITGFLGDDELAVLYQLAELFVYPSRYEGFGIPLVEAMGFGLPIVASRIPSTEEVAGGAAAYYEDPLDACALARKISEVAGQPLLKEHLAKRAKIRAADFTMDKIVKQYVEAYQAALNTRKD
jgi:glycosyltransferase involved in cell wall biosynthesis